MAENVFAKTGYDPYIDWDDVCSTYSKASGHRMWWELDEEGRVVTLFTDGNPKEIWERLFKGVEEAIRWERNARLN